MRRRNEPDPPSLAERVDRFDDLLAQLRTVVETDLKRLEDEAEAAGASWTPGRIPRCRAE